MGKRKNIDDLIYGDRSNVRKSASIYDFGGSKGSLGYGSKSSGWTGERCYKSHPPLKLPGSELVIYGGSCLSPAAEDADIYIGFDGGMTFTGKQFPWTKGHELLFRIPDMGVPKDVGNFVKLVRWTKEQLEDGMKVHCGCIGGHGRTGTFLAALVAEFGEQDAIQYVRTNYCKKAVESHEQIKFLMKHFGVKNAKGSKSGSSHNYDLMTAPTKSKSKKKVDQYTPISGNGCIWDQS